MPEPEIPSSFSHRAARSASLTALFIFLVAAESSGVHLLLFRRAPIVAVVLSALGLLAAVWLLLDHHTLGKATTRVTSEHLELRVGRRASAVIPLASVAAATQPSWQDLPAFPQPGFLNPTKPAPPNVLLTFTAPVPITLFGSMRRPVDMLALAVDRPDEFLAAIAGKPVASVTSGT